jgi:uncharacterized protein with HEPN domain
MTRDQQRLADYLHHVDCEIVWKTIHSDPPELYRQVRAIVAST